MSWVGRRRRLFSSVAVLWIIFMLQIWVCCECRAGAMRILSGNRMSVKMAPVESQGMTSEEKNEMFRKFFNGRRTFDFNRTDKGLEESKRKVPSCPDPLHN
ncbi:hypothetical protein SLE2022_218770 [Rubroshorea leprosula]